MTLLERFLLVALTFVSAVGLSACAEVRLAGSGLEYEGRLEVYYNGVWGTVCDDSFDDVDATVACKSFGDGYVGRVINNRYGAGTGQIWLDDVECRGNESFIGDCPHRRWGYHDCRHHEDVSISCSNDSLTTTTEPPSSRRVRLAGSGLEYEGRLEVYYNGVWGTVCDDSFDNIDATVACKSLDSGLIHHISVSVARV